MEYLCPNHGTLEPETDSKTGGKVCPTCNQIMLPMEEQ